MNVLKFKSKLFIPVIVFGFFITACASTDTNPATTVGAGGTAYTDSSESAIHVEGKDEMVDTANTHEMGRVDTATTNQMGQRDSMPKVTMDTASKTAIK